MQIREQERVHVYVSYREGAMIILTCMRRPCLDLRHLQICKPEVILNRFTTRIGQRVGRMLAALFQPDPFFKVSDWSICSLYYLLATLRCQDLSSVLGAICPY